MQLKYFYLILELLVLLFCFCLIYTLLKQKRLSKFEKRFASFSLQAKQEDLSFLDKVANFFLKLIKRLGSSLSKIKAFQKIAVAYKKYELISDKLQAIDFVAIKIFLAIAFVLFYFLMQLDHSFIFGVIGYFGLFLLGYFLPDYFYYIQYLKTRRIIKKEFYQAIELINYSLKTNKNIKDAFLVLKDQMPQSINREFNKILKDLTYEIELKDSFKDFAKRVNLKEASDLAVYLAYAKEVNISYQDIFGMYQEWLEKDLEKENEYKSLYNITRYLTKILIVIPLLTIIILYLLFPQYWSVFLTTSLGKIFAFFVFLLYLLYLVIINIIERIK